MHANRPLVCRLYPLGRSRRDGRTVYHHTGTRLPCFDRCPTITEFPLLSVGEYISSQDISAAEAAHDASAALAYGMVKAGKVVANHIPAADAAALPAFFAELRATGAPERPARLPPGWLELLMVPALTVPLDEPALFVQAHGQVLASALQASFAASTAPDALTQATKLYLVLAVQLGTSVGSDPAVMARLVAGKDVQA